MQSESTLQSKKIDLIQLLTTIEDENILNKVTALIEQERGGDLWLTASDAQKASIEKGISDAENGKLKTHTEAKAIYGKWL